MKTVKEFLEERRFGRFYPGLPDSSELSEITEDDMIEFAKLKVQEALKQAAEKIDYEDCYRYSSERNVIDKVEKDILNAYPLENIK